MYFAAAVLAFTPCRRSIATTFTAQIYLTQSVYKEEGGGHAGIILD